VSLRRIAKADVGTALPSLVASELIRLELDVDVRHPSGRTSDHP
jgi:hypothetical protein